MKLIAKILIGIVILLDIVVVCYGIAHYVAKNTDHLYDTAVIADSAYNLAKENRHDIIRIKYILEYSGGLK